MNTQLPERHGRHWTETEDKKLFIEWSNLSVFAIAKKLQRTPWGIAQRARALKLGPFSHGNGISMREFERYSGFSSMKIKAAVKALGLQLPRIIPSDPAHKSPLRRFMIDEDHQDALLKHMLDNPLYFMNEPGAGKTTKGVWGIGRKAPRCKICKRNDIPHFAKDKCKRCYQIKYTKQKARRRARAREQKAGATASSVPFTLHEQVRLDDPVLDLAGHGLGEVLPGPQTM